MFIYELSVMNGLMRINVYQFESLLKSFPKQVLFNYLAYINSEELIREKRNLIVNEEQNLSTRLNTHSFNYDFHIKEISNYILAPNKKYFNVSVQICNLLSFFKTPPKYARNYLDSVVLRIDLGFMNKISDQEFFQSFCARIKHYGFKIFNPKIPQSAPTYNSASNRYMQPKLSNSFYKEECTGEKPKIPDFIQN